MDLDDLERKITSKTKAIIAVDIAGVMCDYEKIFEIIERKKDLFDANSIWQKKWEELQLLLMRHIALVQ